MSKDYISLKRGLSDNFLALYLSEIGKIPLLTPEEEIKLAKRIKKGDHKALNKLVEANLRFVVGVAKKYMHQGISLLDLINEGNLGLIKAAKRFDPAYGFRFTSYAVWWIKQAILQALAEQSKVVRVPLNKAEKLYKVKKTFHSLTQELGREPTLGEMAVKLDMTPDEIREILRLSQAAISLETPIGEDKDDGLINLIEDEKSALSKERLMAIALKKDIRAVLETLSPLERDVIKLRFGLDDADPMTLDEIGRKFGLSRERIRQIEKKAIKRLRSSIRNRMLQSYLN